MVRYSKSCAAVINQIFIVVMEEIAGDGDTGDEALNLSRMDIRY